MVFFESTMIPFDYLFEKDNCGFFPATFKEELPIRVVRRRIPSLKYIAGKRFQENNAVVPSKSEDFGVKLDVKDFLPEEITVKVVDNQVVVEGKHEEKQDKHGFISRQFMRRFTVPENFDLEKIESKLIKNGTMIISAPKLKEETENGFRVIPIERVEKEEMLQKRRKMSEVDN